MITIYLCSIGTEPEGLLGGNYCCDWADKSKRSQWRYIKDVNKANGYIITFAHRESVLRKYFIEPHLNSDGYVKECGEFILKLKNLTINYELVTKINA